MTTSVMRRPGTRGAILATGWVISAVLTAAVAIGGISMDLMLIAMSGWELLGGRPVLPFTADWPGMILRLTGLATAVAVAWGTVRYGRVTGEACRKCGRRDQTHHAGRDRALARRAAWISAVPALGYAGLKLYWAAGGRAGVSDPAILAEVTWSTPGFVDTAMLAVIGIGLVMVMAYRRPRLPRWVPLTGAAFGIVMLLPVAVIGNVMHLVNLAQATAPSQEFTTVTIASVYGCFALWAAGLTVTTFAYWRDTRPRCRQCGQS